MNLKVEKHGTATWYFCPYCFERIVFVNGNLICGEKHERCPKCGQQLDWKEDVIRKKSRWRKFRQAICWIIGGRNQLECKFEVKTSHPDEVICGDCDHNIWR